MEVQKDTFLELLDAKIMQGEVCLLIIKDDMGAVTTELLCHKSGCSLRDYRNKKGDLKKLTEAVCFYKNAPCFLQEYDIHTIPSLMLDKENHNFKSVFIHRDIAEKVNAEFIEELGFEVFVDQDNKNNNKVGD